MWKTERSLWRGEGVCGGMVVRECVEGVERECVEGVVVRECVEGWW